MTHYPGGGRCAVFRCWCRGRVAATCAAYSSRKTLPSWLCYCVCLCLVKTCCAGARKDRFTARCSVVLDDAGAGAGIRAGAGEGDDISGSVPPGESSAGEAYDVSRPFFVTLRTSRRSCLISGPSSTLSTLACSAGMLTLKTRTAG